MGKHKRYKRVRKNLEYYRLNFGLRPPYRLAVDGEFVQQALRFKVHIKEQIPKLFQATVVPCVTKCTVSALRRKGSKYSGAAIIAKRFERIECAHGKGVKKELECLKSLVGEGNGRRLCFGAQAVELRNFVRKVPAAPLLFIRECVPIFEPPSAVSRDAVRERLEEKTSLSREAKRKVEALQTGEERPPEQKGRKRKGPREPNPLSCKKKKRERRVRATARRGQKEGARAQAGAPKGEEEAVPPEDGKKKKISEGERLRRMRRRRRGKRNKKVSLAEAATTMPTDPDGLAAQTGAVDAGAAGTEK